MSLLRIPFIEDPVGPPDPSKPMQRGKRKQKPFVKDTYLIFQTIALKLLRQSFRCSWLLPMLGRPWPPRKDVVADVAHQRE